MTSRRRPARPVRAWIVAALLVASTDISQAQLTETARVTAPVTLTFNVVDPAGVTVASGGTFRVEFDQAVLRSGRAVRISVKADADLTSPGGPSIQAANLSWTASGALNGVAVNGTLSKTQYRTVFDGIVGATTGRVDITWSVDLAGRNVRAGIHTGQLRWRIETVTP